MTAARYFKFLLSVFALLTVVVVASSMIVVHASAHRTYSDITAIPHRSAGLLLGCTRRVASGGENPFFTFRIRAAADLYKAGKIDYIIVSGDNHVVTYNEATDMKDALVAAGVPAERIYPDFAGFRTLDSIVRARAVFGQREITVISQKFHNERAIYLAAHHDIDAVGFNARDVALRFSFDTLLREQFARTRSVLDTLVGTRPRFLGPQIRLGIDPPPVPTARR